MNWKKLAYPLGALGVAGASALIYGSAVESRRIVLERVNLRLPGWPSRLNGHKIGFLADFHFRPGEPTDVAEQAIALVLDEEPETVVIGGDFVDSWSADVIDQVLETLSPLLLMSGNVIAVPGNHDHRPFVSPLEAICDSLNIRLLRNEAWRHNGITWIGIDSLNAGWNDEERAFAGVSADEAKIVLWHEPDAVDLLTHSANLMLSGHSHGGQFILPGGFTPKHSSNGKKYPKGFYPEAPTPLYVTRGVGTTFLPSRLNCPPEATLLKLSSAD